MRAGKQNPIWFFSRGGERPGLEPFFGERQVGTRLCVRLEHLTDRANGKEVGI